MSLDFLILMKKLLNKIFNNKTLKILDKNNLFSNYENKKTINNS